MRRWWRRFFGVEDVRNELLLLRGSIADALARPPLPPFVCVLVEADQNNEDGSTRKTTCGQGGVLRDGELTLQMQAMVPMRNVRVTVFCDLSRVEVRGVFLGVHYVNACVGECPVAFFDGWPVGVLLRIPCGLRRA